MTDHPKTNKAIWGILLRLTCAALNVVMLIISVAVYGAPVPQMAITLLFFIFYIQLPGMLIAGCRR